MEAENEKQKVLATISQATTPQERLVRVLYKIALLANTANCECEICKLAKDLAKEFANLL